MVAVPAQNTQARESENAERVRAISRSMEDIPGLIMCHICSRWMCPECLAGL